MKVAEFVEKLGVLPKDAILLFETDDSDCLFRPGPKSPSQDDLGVNESGQKAVVILLTESDEVVRLDCENSVEDFDGEEGQ